jgi:hypothetical protein
VFSVRQSLTSLSNSSFGSGGIMVRDFPVIRAAFHSGYESLIGSSITQIIKMTFVCVRLEYETV